MKWSSLIQIVENYVYWISQNWKDESKSEHVRQGNESTIQYNV